MRGARHRVFNVGFIGTGARGRTLMQCITVNQSEDRITPLDRAMRGLRVPGSGRARIVAAADPNPQSRKKAEELLAVDVREDPRRVLDDADVEVVVVATTSAAHAEWSVAAMEAGKDVICEKPMATTLEDCDRITEAVGRTKRFFALSMQNRYSYWARTVTDLIRGGQLGEPRMMWCHEFRMPFWPKVDEWISQMNASGGPFLEKNSHHWDIFNWWAQSPARSVYARTSTVGVHPGDIWDTGAAMVEYESGVIANHVLSLATRFGHNLEMGVLGVDGWAAAERTPDGGTVTFRDNHSPQERIYRADLPEPLRIGHAGAELLMQDDIFDCLETGAEPETNCAWGRESIMMGLAAQRSADEGRCVEMAEIRAASRFPGLLPSYHPAPWSPSPDDRERGTVTDVGC